MDDIKKLVEALPQIYQPIYGHPELSSDTIRGCEDRLQHIAPAYDALALHLGRSVRVLDLGCAQGWFALSLAARGARVMGVDYSHENIKLCKGLAREYATLQIGFMVLEIEQIASLLKGDQFDLVLGLSVFHQLCFRSGKKWTKYLLKLVYERIPTALIEMAVKEEEGDFVDAMPADPDYWVEQAPFYRLLAHHSRHLLYKRPIYFCSRRFCYLGDKITEFSTWHDEGDGRRYYFGDKLMAKIFRIQGKASEPNRHTINREAAFLKTPPEGYANLPKVMQTEDTADWSWLVREKIAGTTLDKVIEAKQPYHERAVLLGILRQLATLEKAGLFHADACVWNVVMRDDSSPMLINYDEILAIKREGDRVVAMFSSFLVFVRQVVTRQVFDTAAPQWPFLNPNNLPEPYRDWIVQALKRPLGEWSFAFLLEALERVPGAIGRDGVSK